MSTGRQDESPSFAPNSDILIYATRQGRNGVLETVSADGLIRQKMASGQGGCPGAGLVAVSTILDVIFTLIKSLNLLILLRFKGTKRV